MRVSDKQQATSDEGSTDREYNKDLDKFAAGFAQQDKAERRGAGFGSDQEGSLSMPVEQGKRLSKEERMMAEVKKIHEQNRLADERRQAKNAAEDERTPAEKAAQEEHNAAMLNKWAREGEVLEAAAAARAARAKNAGKK